jgi:hypothetical protein
MMGFICYCDSPSLAYGSVSMKWSLLLEKELDDGVHLLL